MRKINQQKILFDPNDLKNTNAMVKKIRSEFEKNGMKPIFNGTDHESKQITRVQGYSYREFKLLFSDSQEITLRITTNGDIYQVLISLKPDKLEVLPIKNQDDDYAAITEICAKLKANSEKYNALLRKVKVEITDRQKKTRTTILKELLGIKEQLISQRDGLDNEIAQAKEKLALP